MEYKVLNLYACLGGNRLLWKDCQVTAVELDPYLAELYQERFPNDTVIVADAHQYLLDHYKEFDFIWSSPPCPTHSRARFAGFGKSKPVYPDMKLYQEIILLQTHFEGNYCIENVIPYYKPLIDAQKRGRHLYWCNFKLPAKLSDRKVRIGSNSSDEVKKLEEFHKIDVSLYKGKQDLRKIARNLVDYKAGETIFNAARKIYKTNDIKNQQTLF